MNYLSCNDEFQSYTEKDIDQKGFDLKSFSAFFISSMAEGCSLGLWDPRISTRCLQGLWNHPVTSQIGRKVYFFFLLPLAK